MQKDRN